MDLTALLKEVETQASRVSTVYNQKEMLENEFIELESHTMVKHGKSVDIFPLQLQLPFNPIDPKDVRFHEKHRFEVKGGISKFVEALKQDLQTNTELREFYAKLGGIASAEEYDVSEPSVMTEQDFAIFYKYKYPIIPSVDVQKYKTVEAGKYGQTQATTLVRTAEGEIAPECEDQLAYNVLQFEQAIRKEKFAEWKLQNSDPNKLTKDAKDKRDLIKNSMAVTYPAKSGVVFFYEFPCVKGKDELEVISSDEPIKYLRYMNCGTETLKKLMKKIGSRKDKNMDFIQLQISYGDDTGKQTPELNLYSTREFEIIENEAGNYGVVSTFPDFGTKFIDEIDNRLKGEYEKLASRNVYKFRTFTNSQIVDLMFTRVQEVKDYICKEIYLQHHDLLEEINYDFCKELEKMEAAGKLSQSITKTKNALFIEEDIDELDKEDIVDSMSEEAGSDLEALA